MTVTRDQFYLFTMPGDMCPVWAEVFGTDGGHYVAPSPFTQVESAADYIRRSFPAAIVDELCMPADINRAREWARTMPLEQIPA